MKRLPHQCIGLMIGTVAMMLAMTAHATRIEGLGPFEPVAIDGAVPTVSDETMQVGSDTQKLSVTPWPKFLPRRFGKQVVTGQRQLHPAGPVDRITFARAGDTSPWLAIGTGARRASTTVDQWTLQLTRRGWVVSDGYTKKLLGHDAANAKPAMVGTGSKRWCIYLIDAAKPAAQIGVAKETEAQISWAAVRLHQLQKKCSVPRKE